MPEENKDSGGTDLTYDAWLESQDDMVRSLVTGHVSGLTAALQSERDERRRQEAQLRDLAKRAEKGSEMEKLIQTQADELREITRRTAFFDTAHAAGATNLRLAYLAAQEFGLVRDDGTADFEALKSKAPELFASRTVTKGNAGAGTGSDVKGTGMNEFIRAAAGRRA